MFPLPEGFGRSGNSQGCPTGLEPATYGTYGVITPLHIAALPLSYGHHLPSPHTAWGSRWLGASSRPFAALPSRANIAEQGSGTPWRAYRKNPAHRLPVATSRGHLRLPAGLPYRSLPRCKNGQVQQSGV